MLLFSKVAIALPSTLVAQKVGFKAAALLSLLQDDISFGFCWDQVTYSCGMRSDL